LRSRGARAIRSAWIGRDGDQGDPAIHRSAGTEVIATPAAVEVAVVETQARLSVRFLAGVIGVYLMLGALAYWPVLPGISGRLFGLDGDFT